jgi:Xaa-Pro dipeptidase
MSPEDQEKNFSERQDRLQNAMESAGFRAMAINASPSLAYLTGLEFHLSERPVVTLFSVDNSPVIVLPELEAGKLEQVSYPIQGFTYGEDPDTWLGVFRDGLRAANFSGQEVGVEPRWMRLLELNYLEGADLGMTVISGEDCLTQVRICKDDFEIQAMQKAVDIAHNALQAVLPGIRPGTAERELAAEITNQLFRQGSDAQLPFTPLVASGPNGANPHAFPGERRLQNGDLVIIDWGASWDGYFSDLTRTFGLGSPLDELKRAAETVLAANQAARDIAGPGIAAQEVDRAARQVIEAAGFGDYFIHRTGHGLGLEGHEPPYIRAGNPLVLEPGMTFTIEPGIYLPGLGGVRIEDDVLITKQGLLSFSDMSREVTLIDG